MYYLRSLFVRSCHFDGISAFDQLEILFQWISVFLVGTFFVLISRGNLCLINRRNAPFYVTGVFFLMLIKLEIILFSAHWRVIRQQCFVKASFNSFCILFSVHWRVIRQQCFFKASFNSFCIKTCERCIIRLLPNPNELNHQVGLLASRWEIPTPVHGFFSYLDEGATIATGHNSISA